MTRPLIPAVISLGETSSWTSTSEDTVVSLHVRAVLGIDASAALVIRRELVDDHGHVHMHVHGRIVDLVLACDDPAQAERRIRAVDRYSGSPLLTTKALQLIGAERFAEQISVTAETLVLGGRPGEKVGRAQANDRRAQRGRKGTTARRTAARHLH
ncbi:hypothetical protein [Sphingomonas sp. Mn802worker]|uniref:hypothetical protein n=1 Tax=Sphingomonas sp. Mn802worker TaxID=629773 RepID=UPI000376DC63|nr:hypothetical protein [Sphingomonas sp. Mn802worker]